MHYPFRNHDGFARREIDRAIFQIDQQLTADDVEKLICVVVLVPVLFAMNDAESHDRLVHFAQCLVVPLVGARFDETGDIDRFQRLMQNVQPRIVRESSR